MAFKEPNFWWPSKMGRNPSRRNHSLYCTYHRDNGHTINYYRVFKDHLEQLFKAGYLKEFMVGQGGNTVGQTLGNRGNVFPLPLRIIEIIHAAFISISTSC